MTKHKKQIICPKKSTLLAEECGIHFGDGYMRINKDNWGIHYEYTYSGHALDDAPYTEYVKKIMKKLYNVYPAYERTINNGFNMSFYLKDLINFKISIGMPISPKNNLMIPRWIKSKNLFLLNFLRGFIDTDGSLSFKMKKISGLHDYPVISISSKNYQIMKDINLIFSNLGFNNTLFKSYKEASNGTISIVWEINISGEENLKKFIEKMGFNNRKHITKYLIWKKFGFCPAKTTLKQREDIIIGKLNPYLFENASGQI